MNNIEKKFKEMGANAVTLKQKPKGRDNDSNFSIDVITIEGQETFELSLKPGIDLKLDVCQIDKKDKHLLLSVKEYGEISNKFLCGHDERHWFVAGVDDRSSTIWEAKESLKPRVVRANQIGVKRKKLQKRKNEAFVRQGEWFFVPAPNLEVSPNLIIRKESLQRGTGRPHIAEEIYRAGGTPVRANRLYPEGLSEEEYKKELKINPEISKYNWENRVRNASVYARGKVRHPDHKTIELKGWHRVEGNFEVRSKAVAFLD